MEIESLISDELTHDVFKEQIVGLIKRYQNIIEDDETGIEDLFKINNELVELQKWLLEIETNNLAITYEKLGANFLLSQSKLNTIESLLQEKEIQIAQTFEDKANSIDETFETKSTTIDQTFEDKANSIDETFETKSTTIDQTFSDKANSIDETFEEKENNLDQIVQTVQNKLDNGDFKGEIGTNDYNDLDNKPNLGSASSKNVGTSAGDVMGIGAGGILGRAGNNSYISGYPENTIDSVTQVYRRSLEDLGVSPHSASFHFASSDTWGRIRIAYSGGNAWIQGGSTAVSNSEWTAKLYCTANTTVDSNGFIKEASPIINLFTDKIEISGFDNYKTKPTVIRVSKGIYELHNTQGLSSKGWYIETPKNRNNDVYFNVDYTQNKPQPINEIETPVSDIIVTVKVYTRVWNQETGLHENGELIDVNDLQDRFISLRFNDIKVEHVVEDD